MAIKRHPNWHTFYISLPLPGCQGKGRFSRRCTISEYTIVQVEYSDPECIKAALKELGYTFESHQTAQSLKGYQGDTRQQTAEIIVRRRYVGAAANDVGFKRKANGKYELLISEYDRHGQTGVNFMQKMKQLYAKHKTLKQLKKMGKTVTSIKTTDDGRIKIKALG